MINTRVQLSTCVLFIHKDVGCTLNDTGLIVGGAAFQDQEYQSPAVERVVRPLVFISGVLIVYRAFVTLFRIQCPDFMRR